jgi:UTP-glucose-1-phosphate uridylyltransferase
VSASRRIRKVVIPAAGLGIRLLPATKAVPKEMMPIAGRPLIQFAVEEAAASGLETVILAIGKGKNLVAEHFHRNLELEDALVQRGKSEDAEDPAEAGRFGVMDVMPLPDAGDGRTLRVVGVTERPQLGSAFSHYGIFGRYILEPAIFSCIDRTQPGFAGELQLTDSLLLSADRAPLYAYLFQGSHYDAGNKLGFVQATVAYARKDPELAKPLQKHWESLQPPKIRVAV